MFYCREGELRDLNKRYNRGNFECVVIYGRRRGGKTALINEFCKDKPTIFFSALNASAQENLEAFSKAIYEKENPGTDLAPVYPYLAKASKSISSRLQHIIDHTWKNGQLFLILCGSSMSFMEYQVLGYESPLYGRRTGQLKIQALSYKEIKEFNPSLTARQQAFVYGITGGIPHYINKLAVTNDVDEALKENLFNTSICSRSLKIC